MQCEPSPVAVSHQPGDRLAKRDHHTLCNGTLDGEDQNTVQDWLCSSGVLEPARISLLQMLKRDSDTFATEEDRIALTEIRKLFMLNTNMSTDYVARVVAVSMKELISRNLLNQVPGAESTGGAKSSKTTKKAKTDS